MRPVFAFSENGQGLFLVLFFTLNLLLHTSYLLLFHWFDDLAPARHQNLLARSLELHILHFAQHGCRSELTIRIEHGDEMTTDFIIDFLLSKRQALWHHTRRNDGVVVSDFAVVEHFLALGQLLPCQR